MRRTLPGARMLQPPPAWKNLAGESIPPKRAMKCVGNPREDWGEIRRRNLWFLGRKEEGRSPVSLPLHAGTERGERNEEPNASALQPGPPNAAFSLSNARMRPARGFSAAPRFGMLSVPSTNRENTLVSFYRSSACNFLLPFDQTTPFSH
jgi:hypothetical protein